MEKFVLFVLELFLGKSQLQRVYVRSDKRDHY
ncbi:hypothetical protein A5880_000183 [Enterococcus sp. 4G2_DIV0659]|uniref:Uncharacterized protein n=1 Tax=Candidatus Enterococcus mansonii TaxID=1834181 RepID=A0A242CK42_9ENTE|nr:hypothetical protein A5880_001277 [Enterococcus sp. 4G2_DIV0659]